jgi:hypothetical protein
MPPALKASFRRFGTLLLATVAGSSMQPAEMARGQVDTQQSPAAPNDQGTWTIARRAGTVAAYQRYLELFPTGAYAEDAFRLLIESSLRAPRPVNLVQIEPGAGPTGPTRELQVAAADLSLY